jgi:hypothetical protein
MAHHRRYRQKQNPPSRVIRKPVSLHGSNGVTYHSPNGAVVTWQTPRDIVVVPRRGELTVSWPVS